MDAPLDRTDLRILRLLAEDARISLRQLARRVGMSPPAVADRVARLERLGVIRGYRAEIDREKLGYPLVVILGVVAVQGSLQGELVEALAQMPEVEDVHLVTGPKDLLVRLRLRDSTHLREMLFEKIWAMPGVDRTETFVALGGMRSKPYDAELLDRLLGSPGDTVAGSELEPPVGGGAIEPSPPDVPGEGRKRRARRGTVTRSGDTRSTT